MARRAIGITAMAGATIQAVDRLPVDHQVVAGVFLAPHALDATKGLPFYLTGDFIARETV